MELAELVLVKKKNAIVVNGVELPIETSIFVSIEPRQPGNLAAYRISVDPDSVEADTIFRILLSHDTVTVQGTVYDRTTFNFETGFSYDDFQDDDSDEDFSDEREVAGVRIIRTLSTTRREL